MDQKIRGNLEPVAVRELPDDVEFDLATPQNAKQDL
jgi:hypothetical protein